MNNIYLAFLTGLTTGGISCFAVQSGLLASSLGTNNSRKEYLVKVTLFLLSKLVSYSFLGLLLGYIGSYISFSNTIQALIQLFVGLFLIITAARIADIHPIFRKLTLTTPKWMFKFARNTSKYEGSLAPLLAGFVTILIPCGVTQAMMLSSVTSGSAFSGALILFVFILGTMPSFFLLGVFASEVLRNRKMSIIASLVILIFGFSSINSALALTGSNHTFQNYMRVLRDNDTSSREPVDVTNGVQEVEIKISNGGYRLENNTIKVGVPVRVKLTTNNTYSCARAFTIPSLGLTKIMKENDVQYIEFTPQKTGVINFSCTMGMYTGSFNVVK